MVTEEMLMGNGKIEVGCIREWMTNFVAEDR